MKLSLIKSLLFAAVIFISACHTSSRAVIRTRPHVPEVRRPLSPSDRYVWVDGEWTWRRGKYHYVKGYYIAPPHNSVWVTGQWMKERRGWKWSPGYWRR